MIVEFDRQLGAALRDSDQVRGSLAVIARSATPSAQRHNARVLYDCFELIHDLLVALRDLSASELAVPDQHIRRALEQLAHGDLESLSAAAISASSVEAAEADFDATGLALEALNRAEKIIERIVSAPSGRDSERLYMVARSIGVQRSALSQLLRIEETERRAEAAAERVEDQAEEAVRQGGVQSEGTLAAEFESFRLAESSAANRFRGAAIALSAAAISYAAAIAWWFGRDGDLLLQKVALLVPVILLAGYLGREAGQHRRDARWAAVMVTQLRTIELYTRQLDPADARDLKTVLGHRVFTATGSGGESKDPGLASLPSLIAELRAVLGAARGQ